MRILGFSKKWDKLQQDEFTTFRFPRRDKDWQVGETVKVVFKPRRKGGGELLGTAEFINKEPRWVKWGVSEEEAIADGFADWRDMWHWLFETYGIRRLVLEPMNKLTVKWLKRELES